MSDRARVLLVLAGIAVLVLTLQGADAPDDTLLWNALFDFGHVPLFGVLGLLLFELSKRILRRWSARWPHYAVAFFAAAALGLLTEAAQFLSPRDADAADALRNSAGALAGLAGRAGFDRELLRGVGRPRLAASLLRLLPLVIVGLASVPLVQVSRVYGERARALPRLVEFGERWSRLLVAPVFASLEAVDAPPGWSAGGRVGRLVLHPSSHPRLALEDVYPDWTGYRSLELAVYSRMPQPLMVRLRIHDAHHDGSDDDRFSRALLLRPGLNEFSIDLEDVRRAPQRREIDLQRMRTVVLFVNETEEPIEILVGNPHLR